jgi:membrane associated rhomboid family serine protease
MFPLGTASRSISSVPFVTVLIILLNAGAFYLELQRGEPFIVKWALTPADVMAGRHPETLITAMFLHGGWLHIIGNMIFLWAFGPAIEEAMGSVRYLAFYLLGGLAASAAQIAGDPQSTISVLGASGAIAAVMGAFLVTFPGDRIRTLIVLFPFVRVVFIPAIVLIGLWIVLQVVAVNAEATQANAGGGGVAYLAHIGGAVFGIIAGRLFDR